MMNESEIIEQLLDVLRCVNCEFKKTGTADENVRYIDADDAGETVTLGAMVESAINVSTGNGGLKVRGRIW